mgnify:CR=1 FL=1
MCLNLFSVFIFLSPFPSSHFQFNYISLLLTVFTLLYSGKSSLLFSIFCLIWFALSLSSFLPFLFTRFVVNCRFATCGAKEGEGKEKGKGENKFAPNHKCQCVCSVFCCRLVSLHFAAASAAAAVVANLIKRQNGFAKEEVLLSCLMSFKFGDSSSLPLLSWSWRQWC